MAQVVLEQLRQEAERFILLMSSPGGNDMAGISGYTVAGMLSAPIESNRIPPHI